MKNQKLFLPELTFADSKGDGGKTVLVLEIHLNKAGEVNEISMTSTVGKEAEASRVAYSLGAGVQGGKIAKLLQSTVLAKALQRGEAG
jgi:hypothetical protein